MRSSIHSNRLQLIGVTLALVAVLITIQQQASRDASATETPLSLVVSRQSTMAILTVPGNQVIGVNGARAITGMTILSGANVATPNQVSARVDLGLMAIIDIAANTRAKIEFEKTVRVTLTQGCVRLQLRTGATGETVTPGGPFNANDQPLEVCYPQGKWPAIEEDANKSLFHLAKVAALALIGGRTGTNSSIGLDDRGSNPGPSTP